MAAIVKSAGSASVACCALILSGCLAMTPPSEDPVLLKLAELERRLESIERVVQNQSLVSLAQDVSALERRVDELQGTTEEIAYAATETTDRQRELYADLDSRIQELSERLESASVSVLDGGPLAPGQLPLPGGTDRDNYQAAFELLKQQRYEPAALAFQQFLVTYPDSDLAANAQYWLAESYYVTQRFEEALAAFGAVVNTYPGSGKVPDAILKIGYCNYELERWDEAKRSLRRVQSEYPETTAARLALQRLERMTEEGV